MKNNDYVLIYDDACPLCAAYTSGFVKTGLLTAENRKSFSTTDSALLCRIDVNKAVNEIPLIDITNNKTYYGIDSLLQILDQKVPLVKMIGNIAPIKWFLQKLYKFISYNRKVIVASQPPLKGFDCSPAFNIKYRLIFMLTFLIFNTLMLFPIQRWILQNSMFASTDVFQLQLAHGIFVLINVSLMFTLKTKRAIEYLGQVNMLALIVILLLIPLALMNKFGLITSAGANNFFLGMTCMIVLKEYPRRMKYAGMWRKHRFVRCINIVCVLAFLTYLVL